MQPSASNRRSGSQWSDPSEPFDDGLTSRTYHPVTASGLSIAKPHSVTESSSSSDDRPSWLIGSRILDTRTPPSSSCSHEESSSADDSREVAPALGPLHRSASAASSQGSSVSFVDAPTTRLTLSAFRRPERAIRLTQSDPRRLIADEYDLYGPGCRVLGHGAFSTVRLALRRSNGDRVAVKTIAKHEALRSRRLRVSGRRYLEEWEVLRKFGCHPNIVNLIDVFENDEEIQLVLEYCRGGELFDAIRGRCASNGGLTEEQASQVTGQILNALSAMHSQGIVHRDVKTENILLVSPPCESAASGAGDVLHVKLCDFGMARALHPENEDSTSSSEGEDSPISPGIGRSYSIVGSNYYMAPEVGDGEGYSTAIDLYSLGVTLYILLCGFPPVFSSGSDVPRVIFPANVSDKAQSLVEKLLHAHAYARITAQEALTDPWIQQHACPATIPAPPPLSAALVAPRSRIGPVVSDAAQGLELVRHCLYQSFGKRARCLSSSSSNAAPTPSLVPNHLRPPKRQRRRRSSSCLLALADLYRDVSAPTALTLAESSSAAPSPPVTNRAVVATTVVVPPGASVVVPEGRPGGSRPSALPVL